MPIENEELNTRLLRLSNFLVVLFVIQSNPHSELAQKYFNWLHKLAIKPENDQFNCNPEQINALTENKKWEKPEEIKQQSVNQPPASTNGILNQLSQYALHTADYLESCVLHYATSVVTECPSYFHTQQIFKNNHHTLFSSYVDVNQTCIPVQGMLVNQAGLKLISR